MNGLADPLWDLLASLAETVDDTLIAAGAAVCRMYIAPGESATWDVCCECDVDHEGQAWVAVQRYYPVRAFPAPDGPLRCRPEAYAADLAVGVLRCASTVDEGGDPPSGQTLTLEAAKVSRDRTLLHDAVLCQWPADLLPGGLQLRGWRPLGPQGGCVGGLLEISVAVDACDCLPEPEPLSGFGLTPFGEVLGE